MTASYNLLVCRSYPRSNFAKSYYYIILSGSGIQPIVLKKSPLGYCNVQLNLRTTAAAAAKSLQSCLTLCDPIDGSSPGSALPGILQARTLEWVAISFSNA